MADFALDDAILLATRAHKGQADKVGEPYILHPLRVMFSFPPYHWRERIVAVLHDVLEDTDVTRKELVDLGIDPECIVAIEVMTHEKGEPYANYIKGISQHSLAREVKIADIKDNTSMERLLRLDRETQDRLLKKYNKALDVLERRY